MGGRMYLGNQMVTPVIVDYHCSFDEITGNPMDNAALAEDLNAKQDVIEDLETIRSGASAGATALQPNEAITAGTKCKITYDANGLVTAGADLDVSDIPSLSLSKISDVTASASEVNVLDGITASTSELNILDGVTASTSEINILDGITATTTELNYVDGVTSSIQGQIGTLNSLSTDTKTDLVSAINENASDISTNTNNITTINGKIPSDASTTNQLADKNFVNSSISTNTANFIGTFNSVADLEAYSGTLTNNDYAFVISTDTAGNTVYNRYKYTTATTPSSWLFEYALNNSSFTSTQWSAINSGATSNNIGQITTNQNAIGTLLSLTTTTKTDLVSAINEVDGVASTAVQPAAISNMQTTTNLVTSVSSLSTNSQYPSAKLFYDTVGDVVSLINAL